MAGSARSHGTSLPLLAVILLASALRLYGLGTESLWCDEGATLAMAGAPSVAAAVNDAVARDVHPPLYYVLVHLWTRLMGMSEFALRLPSALLGVAVVAMTYLLGVTLADRRSALVAAAILAVMPAAVYYSQEARMYALLGLLLTWLWYCAIRLVRQGDAAATVGLVVTAVLLPYVHYYGALVLAAALVVAAALLWARREHRSRIKWLLLAGLGSALAFAPWLVAGATEQFAHARAGWRVFSVGVGCYPAAAVFVRPFGLDLGFDAYGLMVVGALLLSAWAVLTLCRGRWRGSDEPPLIPGQTCWWLAGYLFIPVVLIWVLAQFTTLWATPRITNITMVPVALMCAVALTGLWRARRRTLAAIIGAAILVPCARGLLVNYSQQQREQWREAGALVSGRDRRGDVILIVNYLWLTELFDHYYDGQAAIYGQNRDVLDRDELARFVRGIWPQRGRLWLLLSHEKQSPILEVVKGVAGTEPPVLEQRFYGIRLFLFGAGPGPGTEPVAGFP